MTRKITPDTSLDILLAEAWQEGWDAAHETPWTDGPTNPYREEA